MPTPTRVMLSLALLSYACNADNTPAQSSADETADASSSDLSGTESATAPTNTSTSTFSTGIDTSTSNSPTTGPTSTGDLTTGQSTGGPAGAGVYARFEVRDNTDTPVEVWAGPWCPAGDCYASDFGGATYECALVSYVGQDRIGIAFELASGEAEPCYTNYASWADAPVYFFQDALCTQPLSIPITLVGGVLYYNSIIENGISPATYYLRSGANCVMADNAAGQVFGVATPVPAAILGVMPDAPYTLSIAY